jgi:thiamine pyrophosphokinase
VIKKVSSQNEHDLDKSVLLVRSLIEAGGTSMIDNLSDEATITVKPASEVQSTAAHLDPRALTTNSCVVVMGAFGGRFDQEMATLSSLHRWLAVFDRMVLLGAHSMAFLLQPGVTHRIRCVNHNNAADQTNAGVVREGPTCGLIPLAGRVRSITTQGLQWDLNQQALEMGVCISSSNALRAETVEVTVQTSDTVLWTIELQEIE